MKRVLLLIALGACIGLFLLSLIGMGYSIGFHKAETADITVLPCSAWTETSHPHIPPFTFTGACALPDGTLSVPSP